ncbi:hypothetical protein [Pseudomonas sp. Marseille-QA0892]
MKGARSGWLGIGLGLMTTMAFAQGTGPTVPDTPPAPLDSEQHRMEPERTTRPSAPPAEDQTLEQENQQRPRSERLPPEVAPGSTNAPASPGRRP